MKPVQERVGHDLSAAVIVGLGEDSWCVSAAFMPFHGTFAPHLPSASGAAVVGAAALAVFGGVSGSFSLVSVSPAPRIFSVQGVNATAVVAHTAEPATLPKVAAPLVIKGLAIGSV